jgi:plastocyanin
MQYQPRPRHRTLWCALILGGATLATAVGMATSSTPAGATTLTQGQANSAQPVVRTHRRTVHVNIHNLAFGPAHLVVSPGTTIVWTNQDGFQHTTTSDHGLWDSGPINPDATFKRVFKKAGTFTYHCTIHPFMLGTIKVTR